MESLLQYRSEPASLSVENIERIGISEIRSSCRKRIVVCEMLNPTCLELDLALVAQEANSQCNSNMELLEQEVGQDSLVSRQRFLWNPMLDLIIY